MTEIRRRLDDVAAEAGFSGVVRLDRAGDVIVDAGYGLADRAHRIPMATDTQVAMASGSKTFTAVAILRLVEEGSLALSTRARELLRDDLPLIADDVTVEQLLCHRSGIGDYLDEDVIDSDDHPMPISVHRLETTEDFLQVLDGFPTKFPAGTDFSYCNGGFIVLALLAERASGRSFHRLVEELVCRPAGMTSTAYLRSDALPGTAALGYLERDGGWRTKVFHLPVVGNGDGGAYTTTADLARFWAALFGGELLGAQSLAAMLTPHGPVDDGDAYGLGCWVQPETGKVTMVGGDAGVVLWSRHDPGKATTATVIGNSGASIRRITDVLDRG